MRIINQRPNSFLVICLITSLLFIFSCQENSDPLSANDQEQIPDVENCAKGKFGHGQMVKFAVFTDAHLYDPTLGTSGKAFEEYLAADRKMIAESQAILESTVRSIIRSNVRYVLVPGDLTKDGELQCHQLMTEYLARIEASGKKVFVVPGNHDIDNPHAASYPGSDIPVPIATISSSDFESIYSEYGYDEAIYRDENSLSYIVQPQPELWFLGLDGCNYKDRFPGLTKTNGMIAPETVAWLDEKLALAQSMNITVIAFMHHGVVEHFPGMESVFWEYLVTGWQDFSQYLLAHGVQMVFTGHHHANDIAVLDNGTDKLYDIQTGSLVTWPSPYRFVDYNMRSKVAKIDTRLVRWTSFAGWNFQDYALQFISSGMTNLVVGYLMTLYVSYEQAVMLEPLVTPTLLAYYHGDEYEMFDPQINAGIMQLINSGDPLAVQFGSLLYGIWNDDTPDSDVMLRLKRNMMIVKYF